MDRYIREDDKKGWFRVRVGTREVNGVRRDDQGGAREEEMGKFEKRFETCTAIR